MKKKEIKRKPAPKPYKSKKGEKYMSPEQLKHFRELLYARKEELMLAGKHFLEKIQYPELPADLADRATQEETLALAVSMRDHNRQQLQKIERALKQIDKQDYGYCEACGEEIGLKRLEIRAAASLCVECQSLSEIRSKNTLSGKRKRE